MHNAARKKKSRSRAVLVRVSALAFLSAPLWANSARAQNLQINCKQAIDIGNLIASGCSGKYIISPDNNHKNTACLIINATAQAGNCQIKVAGKAATKSAVISFVKTAFTLNGTKGGSVTMKSLQMKLRTQATIDTKLTVKVTTLNNGPFLVDIGGALSYSDQQTAGRYTGQVAVTVNFN